MRNELVERTNRLRKNLVLFPAVDLIKAVCNHIKKHELYPSYICTLFFVFHLFSVHFLLFSYRKPVWSFVYVNFYYVGAGITILMSVSDGSDPYFLLWKMEKTLSMKEEMEGEVFISRQSWHFSFIDNMIKVLFSIFTFNWRVNTYVSRQGKGINRRNKSTIIIIYFVAFGTVLIFLKNGNCLL